MQVISHDAMTGESHELVAAELQEIKGLIGDGGAVLHTTECVEERPTGPTESMVSVGDWSVHEPFATRCWTVTIP